MVGHELRTPLNAIIQLSGAMTNNLGESEAGRGGVSLKPQGAECAAGGGEHAAGVCAVSLRQGAAVRSNGRGDGATASAPDASCLPPRPCPAPAPVPLIPLPPPHIPPTHFPGNFGTWERHKSWLETITRSATHLLGIINDIITLRAARTGMHLKQELVRSWEGRGEGGVRGGGVRGGAACAYSVEDVTTVVCASCPPAPPPLRCKWIRW